MFITESHEGESCAIATGGAFFLLTECVRENTEIRVHPANQCGASSKEISDIDVYVNDEVLYTAEVKDKKYTSQDVDHAVRKAKEAGMKALLFVNGPRGVLEGTTALELINRYRQEHFHLIFTELQVYTSQLLFEAPTVDIKGYFTALTDFAKSARVKDATFRHLQNCVERISKSTV